MNCLIAHTADTSLTTAEQTVAVRSSSVHTTCGNGSVYRALLWSRLFGFRRTATTRSIVRVNFCKTEWTTQGGESVQCFYLPHSYSMCSMEQIINSVYFCPPALSRSHLLIDFRKSGTELTSPKSKDEFVGGQRRTAPYLILPPKTAVLGQKVMKVHET